MNAAAWQQEAISDDRWCQLAVFSDGFATERYGLVRIEEK